MNEREAFENFLDEESFKSIKYAQMYPEDCWKIWQAALAHARAETAVVLPKRKATNRVSVSQNMETFAEYHFRDGHNAALDAIRALNPDVKFVEAEGKEI